MDHAQNSTARALARKAAAAATALLLCLGLMAGCAPAPAQDDAAAEPQEPLRICSLKGPTTIGLASLIAEYGIADEPATQADAEGASDANGAAEGAADAEADGAEAAADDATPADGAPYAFELAASADEVAPKLASGDCDIALIPANLAATLYQRTDGAVRVIDVNTLGVLYALTADEALKGAEAPSMADLAGRTVYLTGKGTVPGYTVECLLQAAGVADQVTLDYRSEPTEVAVLIQADPTAVGILPQPYATAAASKDPSLQAVLDLTEQWDLAFDEAADDQEPGRFVTGVTVVRAEVLEQRPQAVAQFLADHAASAALATDDPAAVAPEVVELGIVGSVPVAEKAIPLCNIVCLTGDEMKAALSGYLERLFELAPEALGGALPDDAFYCTDVEAQ